ncbi:MAG: hypothetical protein H0X40_16875 [Chthoniobacterales bacterium]|nr:hypothetical protein [Chthoniobacterales bacterium]
MNLEHRLPLSLFYFERLDCQEIARILELPDATALSRLGTAKTIFRQRLEEQCSDHKPATFPPSKGTEGGPNG